MASKFSDQLRKVIDDSGFTRYRICKEIGMDQSVMSRFMAGSGGLSVEMLDLLCELLGLKLVQVKEPAKGKGR